MTAIVMLEHDGDVYAAADSTSVTGDGRLYRNVRKIRIVTVSGNRAGYELEHRALIAHCGLSIVGPAFARGVKWASDEVGTWSGTDLDEWAQDRADDLTRLTHGSDTPPLANGREHVGGVILLAHRGRAYQLTDGVSYRGERFLAEGSGGEVALGALVSMLENNPPPSAEKHLPPETMVARAVEIAGRYDDGTGALGQVVCLHGHGGVHEWSNPVALLAE